MTATATGTPLLLPAVSGGGATLLAGLGLLLLLGGAPWLRRRFAQR